MQFILHYTNTLVDDDASGFFASMNAILIAMPSFFSTCLPFVQI